MKVSGIRNANRKLLLNLSDFLVDTYCLGVKDAMYRVVSPEEFEYYRQQTRDRTPLKSVQQQRKIIETLKRNLGSDGFDFCS